MPVMEIHVAVLPAPSPEMSADGLTAFARRLGEDVTPALEEATGIRWVFHVLESNRLPTDVLHRPSDFLDAASLA
jgi:hypothetical protein